MRRALWYSSFLSSAYEEKTGRLFCVISKGKGHPGEKARGTDPGTFDRRRACHFAGSHLLGFALRMHRRWVHANSSQFRKASANIPGHRPDTGWLEPLLDRIARNSTTVVCPVIDVIDDTTLEYHWRDSGGVNVGGFDWNLQFNWHAVPEREKKRHKVGRFLALMHF